MNRYIPHQEDVLVKGRILHPNLGVRQQLGHGLGDIGTEAAIEKDHYTTSLSRIRDPYRLNWQAQHRQGPGRYRSSAGSINNPSDGTNRGSFSAR